MANIERSEKSGELGPAMDRLEAIIEANAYRLLPWHVAEVLDLSRWAPVGESYVKVQIEGDQGDPKWAVYRDGIEPELGQKLMARRMTASNASSWLALPLPKPVIQAITTINPSCLDDMFLVSARGAGGDAILKLDATQRDFKLLVHSDGTPQTIEEYDSLPYDPYTASYPPSSVISPPHWTFVSASPVAGFDVRPLLARFSFPITTPYIGHTAPFTDADLGTLAPRYLTYGYDFGHTSGSGVFYSDNRGASWSPASGIGGCLHIAGPDLFGYALAVGGNGAALYESKDYGATWSAVPSSAPYDGSSWRYVDEPNYQPLVAQDSAATHSEWYDSGRSYNLKVGHRVQPNQYYSGLTTSGAISTLNGFETKWFSDVIDPGLSDSDVQFGSGRLWSRNTLVYFNAEALTNRNAGTLLPADNHLPWVHGDVYRSQFGPIQPGASGMLPYLTAATTRFGPTGSAAYATPINFPDRPDFTGKYKSTDTYPAPFAAGVADGSYTPGDSEAWVNTANNQHAYSIINGNPGGGLAEGLFWNALNNYEAGQYAGDSRDTSKDGLEVIDGTTDANCALVALEGNRWRLARATGGYAYHGPTSSSPDFYSFFVNLDPPVSPDNMSFSQSMTSFRNPGYGSIYFEDVGVLQAEDLGGQYTASRLGIAPWNIIISSYSVG